jgi:hypothetical protein
VQRGRGHPAIYPARPDLAPGLRMAVHGRYLVLFRELPGENGVRIERVLHGARNLPRLLQPMAIWGVRPLPGAPFGRRWPDTASPRSFTPIRAANSPAPTSPACCCATASPSAWTGAAHGGTTCL